MLAIWWMTCLLSAVLCGLRAACQGYSVACFASLGLVLGLGAVPVTCLATQVSLRPEPAGSGITRISREQPNAEQEGWRQLRLLVVLGGGGGFLTYLGIVLVSLWPVIFQPTPAEAQAEIDRWGCYAADRVAQIWMLFSLALPLVAYELLERLSAGRRFRAPHPVFVPAALLVLILGSAELSVRLYDLLNSGSE